MKIEFLQPEPNLEFGNGGLFPDVRFGIGHFGVYDFRNPGLRAINIGIVGSEESIDGLSEWLGFCQHYIPSASPKQPNLFPPFPGFALSHSFCAKLLWGVDSTRTISIPKAKASGKKKEFNECVSEIVAIYAREIEYIVEKSSVDVIICAIPIEQLALTTYPYPNLRNQGVLDFHDALKAELLRFRVPIQIVLPATYDDTKLAEQKKLIKRDQQDEATRAWNLHTALYYKSKGIPWRMVRQESDLVTCFLGVSFYTSLNKTQVFASSAQVFNERGEGVVVRGGLAFEDTDKQVRLGEAGAHSLAARALSSYRNEHFNYPARIVVHKTSSFSSDEIAGFRKAFTEKGIDKFDFVYLRPSITRLFRTKNYPTLRGTLWHQSETQGLLYTKGSIPFYETFPGKYPPQSLYIDVSASQRPLKQIAAECLALTKMNWNSTRFDQKLPITLQAAREVGSILKYVPKDSSKNIPQSYRFYM